jgi:hypothetical protein
MYRQRREESSAMNESQVTPKGDAFGPDRRRYPRFETMGRVVGTLLSVDLPVRVRDVGFGGFAIETVEPVVPGQIHRVRLTTADDWSTVVEARSLHCRPSCAADGTPRYVTGFALVTPEAPDTQRGVARIIESITSLQMYDA